MAGVEVLRTDGCASVLPGSSFITPVALAMASTPESASTIPTKPAQFCQKPPCNGCKCPIASPMCGRLKSPRTTTTIAVGTEIKKSETAGVFRSKQIEQPNNEDGRGGEFLRMRNTEVLKPGKRADGRRYQIISDEEKGADDGDDFGAMAHARINAAAVRIKAADDHVVEADQRGEHAHCGDQPK